MIKRVVPGFTALFMLCFFALPLFALDPVPKVLTQVKLDKFISEMDKVTSDATISAAWDASYQNASMEELYDPNSPMLSGDIMTGIFSVLNRTRLKCKQNAGANTALTKLGWTSEFWDIYVIVIISLQYCSVEESNTDRVQLGMGIAPMTPVTKFIHKDDYTIVKNNYKKIFSLMEEEISKANGW